MKKDTYFAKENEFPKKCYIIDANDKILGRVAVKAATILRGKHKRTYTPHIDSGDVVIIINAEKVRVTGKKVTDKIYQKYTGYPGGQRLASFEQLMAKQPTQILRLAINRMIPKGPLGNQIKRKLKIYTGDQHPHQAQQPVALAV